jgi:hypothetical protein
MEGWGRKRHRKGEKGSEKAKRERASFPQGSMSSDEDVPAPSPSASVVARRASREAKSMREESSSDEDTSSNEEWVPAQEQDEEDEEDEGNWGIVDAREESKGGVREKGE